MGTYKTCRQGTKDKFDKTTHHLEWIFEDIWKTLYKQDGKIQRKLKNTHKAFGNAGAELEEVNDLDTRFLSKNIVRHFAV